MWANLNLKSLQDKFQESLHDLESSLAVATTSSSTSTQQPSTPTASRQQPPRGDSPRSTQSPSRISTSSPSRTSSITSPGSSSSRLPLSPTSLATAQQSASQLADSALSSLRASLRKGRQSFDAARASLEQPASPSGPHPGNGRRTTSMDSLNSTTGSIREREMEDKGKGKLQELIEIEDENKEPLVEVGKESETVEPLVDLSEPTPTPSVKEEKSKVAEVPNKPEVEEDDTEDEDAWGVSGGGDEEEPQAEGEGVAVPTDERVEEVKEEAAAPLQADIPAPAVSSTSPDDDKLEETASSSHSTPLTDPAVSESTNAVPEVSSTKPLVNPVLANLQQESLDASNDLTADTPRPTQLAVEPETEVKELDDEADEDGWDLPEVEAEEEAEEEKKSESMEPREEETENVGEEKKTDTGKNMIDESVRDSPEGGENEATATPVIESKKTLDPLSEPFTPSATPPKSPSLPPTTRDADPNEPPTEIVADVEEPVPHEEESTSASTAPPLESPNLPLSTSPSLTDLTELPSDPAEATGSELAAPPTDLAEPSPLPTSQPESIDADPLSEAEPESHIDSTVPVQVPPPNETPSSPSKSTEPPIDENTDSVSAPSSALPPSSLTAPILSLDDPLSAPSAEPDLVLTATAPTVLGNDFVSTEPEEHAEEERTLETSKEDSEKKEQEPVEEKPAEEEIIEAKSSDAVEPVESVEEAEEVEDLKATEIANPTMETPLVEPEEAEVRGNEEIVENEDELTKAQDEPTSVEEESRLLDDAETKEDGEDQVDVVATPAEESSKGETSVEESVLPVDEAQVATDETSQQEDGPEVPQVELEPDVPLADEEEPVPSAEKVEEPEAQSTIASIPVEAESAIGSTQVEAEPAEPAVEPGPSKASEEPEEDDVAPPVPIKDDSPSPPRERSIDLPVVEPSSTCSPALPPPPVEDASESPDKVQPSGDEPSESQPSETRPRTVSISQEPRFIELQESHAKLETLKTSLDRLVSDLIPSISDVSDVEALGDELKNLRAKGDLGMAEVRRLTGQLEQQNSRLEELRDTHRAEHESQQSEIDALRDSLSARNASLEEANDKLAAAEKSAEHTRQEIVKAADEYDKLKLVAKEEEEKRIKALSLLRALRQKLVKNEQEKGNNEQELEKARKGEKEALETLKSDRVRFDKEIVSLRTAHEAQIAKLRSGFEREVQALKERYDKDAVSKRGQFELDAIHVKATQAKELAAKDARISQLEGAVRDLTKSRDQVFEEAQSKTEEIEAIKIEDEALRSRTTEVEYELKEAKDRVAALVDELEELKRSKRDLNRDDSNARKLLGEAEARHEARIRELEARARQLEKDRHETEEEMGRNMQDRLKEVERMRAALAQKDLDYAESVQNSQKREAKIAEAEKARSDLEKRLQNLEEMLKSVKEDADKAIHAEAAVREELSDRLERSAELEARLEEVQTKESTLRSNNKTLREELRKLQSGVLLSEKQRHPGVGYFSSFNSNSSATINQSNSNHNNNGGLPSPDGAPPSSAGLSQVISPSASVTSLASQATSGGLGGSARANGSADEALNFEYLRNVILQFLEKPEMRPHLISVLGVILHFTPSESRRLIAKAGH